MMYKRYRVKEETKQHGSRETRRGARKEALACSLPSLANDDAVNYEAHSSSMAGISRVLIGIKINLILLSSTSDSGIDIFSVCIFSS